MTLTCSGMIQMKSTPKIKRLLQTLLTPIALPIPTAMMCFPTSLKRLSSKIQRLDTAKGAAPFSLLEAGSSLRISHEDIFVRLRPMNEFAYYAFPLAVAEWYQSRYFFAWLWDFSKLAVHDTPLLSTQLRWASSCKRPPKSDAINPILRSRRDMRCRNQDPEAKLKAQFSPGLNHAKDSERRGLTMNVASKWLPTASPRSACNYLGPSGAPIARQWANSETVGSKDLWRNNILLYSVQSSLYTLSFLNLSNRAKTLTTR